MTHAIVPPYLLARIAAAREPTWARAAQAARATLETPREYRPVRSRAADVDRGAAERSWSRAPPHPTARSPTRKQLERLPGVRVRGEDDPPTGDVAVDEAFDGLGATFDFFWDAYRRSSIDGAGGPLLATVHYGRDYDNAFWNGERMVFGDGDGEVFVGFTGSLTVIAHELAHGVTEYEGGLVYQGQSGALNESISDVFGALTEQHHRGADRRGGELADRRGHLHRRCAGRGPALSRGARHGVRRRRARARPAARAHGRLRPTSDDNGGVHINSGIPNHAFYLAARALGGHAWERAGLIWYRTLTSGHGRRRTADFTAFARATLAAAEAEYGEGSEEVDAVRAGWTGVGVLDGRSDAA